MVRFDSSVEYCRWPRLSITPMLPMLLTWLLVWVLVCLPPCNALLVVSDPPDHRIRNQHLLAQVSNERILSSSSSSANAGPGEPPLPSDRSWTFRNSSGTLFRCSVGSENKAESKQDLATSYKGKRIAFSQEALDARVELLRGTCVTHDGGWWVTRWCHATEVRQVHHEGAREVTAYSLGKFSGGEVRMADTATDKAAAAGLETVSDSEGATSKSVPLFYAEMFSNGNVCDETGRPRTTEVRMYCCPKDKVVSLVSLQETTTCSYTMTLCWATLCEAGLPPLAPNSRDTWAATRPLTGLCFRYAGDTGITHEVCFEKTARSFREVQMKSPLKVTRKGGVVIQQQQQQQQRVVETDEKQLGRYNPSGSLNAGQEEGLESSEVSTARDEERMLFQVYTDGDACPGGKEGETYYTQVKIACFLIRSSPPSIVSARWISRCGTLILMHAPGLCDADDEHRLRLRKRRRRLNSGSSGESQNVAREDGEEDDDGFSLESETELNRVSCVEVK